MEQQQAPKAEDKVVLDGNEVSRDQLKEAQEKKSVRIIETSDNTFKTLKKLHG
jgi:hypothetical protein